MANKRRKKRGTPMHPPSPAAMPPPATAGEVVAPKSKILQAGERMVTSAIDSALQNLWSIIFSLIGSAAMTAAVAIILYFRAPESQWIYALLKYGLAFMGGILTFASVLTLLALIGARRRRFRDQKHFNIQRFISTEKGPLDYRAELQPTVKAFQRVIGEIATTLGKIATRSGKIGRRMAFWDRISPALSLRSASRGAAKLNKHAENMERLALDLDTRTNAFIEVALGNLRWTPAASAGNRDKLLALEDALNVIDAATLNAEVGLNNFRESALAVRGHSSMDLNTSVNWLVAATDELVRILKGLQAKIASEVRPQLQRKLNT